MDIGYLFRPSKPIPKYTFASKRVNIVHNSRTSQPTGRMSDILKEFFKHFFSF